MIMSYMIGAGGGSESASTGEFDVMLDRLYKWRADVTSERDDLLQVLWKV